MDKGLFCHSLKQDFGSLFFRFSLLYCTGIVRELYGNSTGMSAVGHERDGIAERFVIRVLR